MRRSVCFCVALLLLAGLRGLARQDPKQDQPKQDQAQQDQAQPAPNHAPAESAPPASGDKSQPASPNQAQTPDSTSLEPIKIGKATYPLQAEEKGIQGQVLLQIYVSETGDVGNVEVLSGDPVLIPSAVAAAKKWKFKPFIKNGKPIKVSAKVPMDFAFGDKVKDIPDKAATAANGAAASGAVNLPSGIMAGQLVHKVAPIYPREARANHVEGTVLLEASIDKDGRIKGLTVISGPRELRDSAVGAVQQWRYRPYLVNGEPVEVQTQIQVNYQLSF